MEPILEGACRLVDAPDGVHILEPVGGGVTQVVQVVGLSPLQQVRFESSSYRVDILDLLVDRLVLLNDRMASLLKLPLLVRLAVGFVALAGILRGAIVAQS